MNAHGRLRVLSLVSLPTDLVIEDMDMLERFGKAAQSLKSLTIADMREVNPKLKQNLVILFQIMLDGGSTPETLKLCNLGFDCQAAE